MGHYVQCKLQKGNTHQTSWIPKEHASLNTVLKLRENGVWEDGWVVVFAGAERDTPPDWRRSTRKHRDNTGDSLPKESKDARTIDAKTT